MSPRARTQKKTPDQIRTDRGLQAAYPRPGPGSDGNQQPYRCGLQRKTDRAGLPPVRAMGRGRRQPGHRGTGLQGTRCGQGRRAPLRQCGRRDVPDKGRGLEGEQAGQDIPAREPCGGQFRAQAVDGLRLCHPSGRPRGLRQKDGLPSGEPEQTCLHRGRGEVDMEMVRAEPSREYTESGLLPFEGASMRIREALLQGRKGKGAMDRYDGTDHVGQRDRPRYPRDRKPAGAPWDRRKKERADQLLPQEQGQDAISRVYRKRVAHRVGRHRIRP